MPARSGIPYTVYIYIWPLRINITNPVPLVVWPSKPLSSPRVHPAIDVSMNRQYMIYYTGSTTIYVLLTPWLTIDIAERRNPNLDDVKTEHRRVTTWCRLDRSNVGFIVCSRLPSDPVTYDLGRFNYEIRNMDTLTCYNNLRWSMTGCRSPPENQQGMQLFDSRPPPPRNCTSALTQPIRRYYIQRLNLLASC